MTTEQLNRGNQLRRLESLGLISPTPDERSPRLADPRDASAPLEARPGLPPGQLRPLPSGGRRRLGERGLRLAYASDRDPALDAPPLQGGFGLPDARIIAPGEPDRSVLYYRMAKLGNGRMPRVGSACVDVEGTRLIAGWIGSMRRTGPDLPDRGVEEALARATATGRERSEAITRLVGSTARSPGLVRAVDAGSIPEPVGREAAARASETAAPEVVDLLDRFLPDSERPRRLGDAIDPAAILGRAGDAGRGRDLFRAGGAAACRSCHRAEGIGTESGPPLDGIGSNMPAPSCSPTFSTPRVSSSRSTRP